MLDSLSNVVLDLHETIERPRRRKGPVRWMRRRVSWLLLAGWVLLPLLPLIGLGLSSVLGLRLF